jgi:protein SCO1
MYASGPADIPGVMGAADHLRAHTLRAAAPMLLAAMAVGLAGCGSSGVDPLRSVTSATDRTQARSASGAAHALQGGLIVNPPVAAPPLRLPSYVGGRPLSISSMRGHAVFVTFVYTHCPDICPLIVSDLAAAQRALGKRARSARFIAVTIDPRRDTPTAVRAFLAARGAIGRVQFALGSHRALAQVWKAWHVTILPGADATLSHSSVVYGIDGRGMIRVMYPANFTPAQIVHDVPLLARS